MSTTKNAPRTSKFIEGLMNDEPSQCPPLAFLERESFVRAELLREASDEEQKTTQIPSGANSSNFCESSSTCRPCRPYEPFKPSTPFKLSKHAFHRVGLAIASKFGFGHAQHSKHITITVVAPQAQYHNQRKTNIQDLRKEEAEAKYAEFKKNMKTTICGIPPTAIVPPQTQHVNFNKDHRKEEAEAKYVEFKENIETTICAIPPTSISPPQTQHVNFNKDHRKEEAEAKYVKFKEDMKNTICVFPPTSISTFNEPHNNQHSNQHSTYIQELRKANAEARYAEFKKNMKSTFCGVPPTPRTHKKQDSGIDVQNVQLEETVGTIVQETVPFVLGYVEDVFSSSPSAASSVTQSSYSPITCHDEKRYGRLFAESEARPSEILKSYESTIKLKQKPSIISNLTLFKKWKKVSTSSSALPNDQDDRQRHITKNSKKHIKLSKKLQRLEKKLITTRKKLADLEPPLIIPAAVDVQDYTHSRAAQDSQKSPIALGSAGQNRFGGVTLDDCF